MRLSSAMGSSKYEFDQTGLDRDISARESFYCELRSQWGKESGSPRDIYERLTTPESFLSATKEYESRGYTFRFTHEGFFEQVLIFCSELQSN